MKFITRLSFISILVVLSGIHAVKANSLADSLAIFEEDNPYFQYVSRIDFSDVKKPQVLEPGRVY